MAKTHKLLTKLSQNLQLPADIAAGLPHLTLNGFCECSLDCHTGIVEYGENEIVVALNIGRVSISGSGLQLRQMHREGLTVTGSIRELRFEGGAG